MRHPDQLALVLPNETVSRLNLDYTPFHWPSSEKFPEHGGFWVEEPWEGYRQRKWYAAAREPYERLQQLLAPNSEDWIEAECLAALIPDAGGHNFSFQVNGISLSSSLSESSKLNKLFCQRKMRFLVTTCRARISGGGMMPDGKKRGYGIGFDVAALREVDAIKRQRNQEKNQLFGIFMYPVIADLAKNKFFGLFGNRCFKCGSTHSLEIDHHIPIVLGGHLVPGNLVALCSRCNNRKLDSPPESFYSKEELDRLQPFLADQSAIFSFAFDWDYWERDREGYLLELGIDRSLVSEVLTDSNHRFYIPPPSKPGEGIGVVITVDNDLITQILRESNSLGKEP